MTNVTNIDKARKSLPWFRFYTEALDDPKVQMLPPHLFKAWVNLLCLACKTDGKLPSINDIAFALRLSVDSAREAVDELVLAGLLDVSHVTKIVSPHNWKARQFKSDTSADRTRKWRKNKNNKLSTCDVTDTVAVTPPDKSRTKHISLLRKEQKGGSEFLNNCLVNLSPHKPMEFELYARRAEGLGLDLSEITAIVDESRPGNRVAFFIGICKSKLKEKLGKQFSDTVLHQAICNKKTDEPFKLVMQALLEVKA